MLTYYSHLLFFMVFAALASRRRPRGLAAAIDVGSSKLACWAIYAEHGAHSLKLVGQGLRGTEGFKSGMVVNVKALEAGILEVLHQAEKDAGDAITHVVFTCSNPKVKSTIHSLSSFLPHGLVTPQDVNGLMEQAVKMQALEPGFGVLHTLPLAFSLDGARGIASPLNLIGQELGAVIHCITAPLVPLKNIALALERCHVEVIGCVAGGYAAGVGCLVPDEQELGVTIIDIGATATTLAFFFGGTCVHLDTIALGSLHITQDIARCLETSLSCAERIKTLYGAVLSSGNDFREAIQVMDLGDTEGNYRMVPKNYIVDIIHARIHAIVEHIKHKLQGENAFLLRQRIVLTGGGSKLAGLRDYIAQILGCHVRIGTPLHLEETILPLGAEGCALAGALMTAFPYSLGSQEKKHLPAPSHTNLLRRITSWLKHNL